MVVGYRTSGLTYMIARRLVDVPYIALANLVAGRAVVPELIQAELTPERAAALIGPLLDPTDPAREEIVHGLSTVRSRLGEPGCSRRVARACVELIGGDP